MIRPDNLDKIQDFISKARDPVKEDYKTCMKFPYVATQLISEYRIERVMEAFLEVGTAKEGRRLNRLFDVYRNIDIDGLNPTLTGYFDEALVSLLRTFPRVVGSATDTDIENFTRQGEPEAADRQPR